MSTIQAYPATRIIAPVALFLILTAAHLLKQPSQGTDVDSGSRLLAAVMPILLTTIFLVWIVRAKRYILSDTMLVVSGLLFPWYSTAFPLHAIRRITKLRSRFLFRNKICIDFGSRGTVVLPLSYEHAERLHEGLQDALERYFHEVS